jgi:type IV secretion system protein VirB9
MKFFYTLFLSFLLASSSLASELQDSKRDPRIKIIPFVKNQVVELEANRFIGTVIHFLDDEQIMEPIAFGDPNAWTVSVQSDRDLIISPILDTPDTNMTVRTTKRFYYFYLTASENRGASPTATQALRFIDPHQNELNRRAGRIASNNSWTINAKPSDSKVVPDAIGHLYDPVPAEMWNFRYDFKINNKLGLEQVFDNGVKTYFSFSDNAKLPALFVVRENGESLVQIAPTPEGYVAAFTTAKKWVLRRGKTKLYVELKGR